MLLWKQSVAISFFVPTFESQATSQRTAENYVIVNYENYFEISQIIFSSFAFDYTLSHSRTCVNVRISNI